MKTRNLGFYLLVFFWLILLTSCGGTAPAAANPTPIIEQVTLSEPTPEAAAAVCPPYYSEPEKVLNFNHPPDVIGMAASDLNNDNLTDVLFTRIFDSQMEAAEMVILLNDGNGSFFEGNSEVFTDSVPGTFLAREIVLADFNGDDRNDIFIADHGLDAPLNLAQKTLWCYQPSIIKWRMLQANGLILWIIHIRLRLQILMRMVMRTYISGTSGAKLTLSQPYI